MSISGLIDLKYISEYHELGDKGMQKTPTSSQKAGLNARYRGICAISA